MRHCISMLLFLMGCFLPPARAQWPHRQDGNHSFTEKSGFPAYPNALSLRVDGGLMNALPAASAGLEYERFLDRAGHFSAAIAVRAFRGASADFGEFAPGDTRYRLQGVFATPGLSYHPTGNKRRGDFSVGLALIAGQFTSDVRRRDRTGTESMTQEEGPLAGVLVQVGIDGHLRAHFLPGLRFNFGYIGSGPKNIPDTGDIGNRLLLQLGIRLGLAG